MTTPSSQNPLALPRSDSETLQIFMEHYDLKGDDLKRDGLRRDDGPSTRLIEPISMAFSQIPYENLTKIIKLREVGTAENARRGPGEVIQDHIALGAGGTCFSLTASFLHLLRALGLRAEPILADRKYGANTHCALLVWLDGKPHLLDPGYLIVKPIELANTTKRVLTAFNEVVLEPRDGGEKMDLYTIQQGHRTYRLTFKCSPVDNGEFLAAWDASFDWDMMQYPVLTRVLGDQQLYLQDQRFQVRSIEATTRKEISTEDVITTIKCDFGIQKDLARKALEILQKGKR